MRIRRHRILRTRPRISRRTVRRLAGRTALGALLVLVSAVLDPSGTLLLLLAVGCLGALADRIYLNLRRRPRGHSQASKARRPPNPPRRRPA
jgi:hypothetical protein